MDPVGRHGDGITVPLKVFILSIDGCDPQERIQAYLSMPFANEKVFAFEACYFSSFLSPLVHLLVALWHISTMILMRNHRAFLYLQSIVE